MVSMKMVSMKMVSMNMVSTVKMVSMKMNMEGVDASRANNGRGYEHDDERDDLSSSTSTSIENQSF